MSSLWDKCEKFQFVQDTKKNYSDMESTTVTAAPIAFIYNPTYLIVQFYLKKIPRISHSFYFDE